MGEILLAIARPITLSPKQATHLLSPGLFCTQKNSNQKPT
jgi:hypothetical protein